MCASRWFTPIRGKPLPSARPFATFIPTTNEPGSPGPRVDRNSIYISQAHVRLHQRLLDDRVNGQNMLAGGHFREHAPKASMQFRLRSYQAGQDNPPALHYCRGGFVAGRFHPQDARLVEALVSLPLYSQPSGLSLSRCFSLILYFIGRTRSIGYSARVSISPDGFTQKVFSRRTPSPCSG